jgi:hypothetical protein
MSRTFKERERIIRGKPPGRVRLTRADIFKIERVNNYEYSGESDEDDNDKNDDDDDDDDDESGEQESSDDDAQGEIDHEEVPKGSSKAKRIPPAKTYSKVSIRNLRSCAR